MLKSFAGGVAAICLLASGAFAAAQSGPQKGHAINSHAFQVVDVSGAAKGQQLCYY